MSEKTAIESGEGKVSFERVPFDSEIFGIEVARIADCTAKTAEGFEALHRTAVAEAAAKGFVHLSRRVLGDDYAEIAGLERAGYGLLDAGVVFDHDLKDVVATEKTPGVKVAEEADIKRVVDECAGIFRGSRYYHDPVFNAEGADEVHRRWIWNCFRGRADVILVPEDTTAFVTCAVDASGLGNIALFGVAKSAQGKGAGQKLLRASLSWFATRAKRVEVKTQSTNYPAARMYERGGFRLVRSELTYGRRIGK